MARRRQGKSEVLGTRSIDLHGLRVQEAQERLLDTLNKCILDDIDQLRVIHGLGTGKVKAAVYEILKDSRHVKDFRIEMGNPGVTVVYL